MGNDNLALIAKEYVRRRDYEAAIAIVDSIAQRDARKAQAVYRFAFHRSFAEIFSDLFRVAIIRLAR